MALYSGAIGAALGPVAAILLTSIMTPYVMILEKRVADEIVNDPTALDRFQKVTMARVVVDGLGSMAGSGGGEIMKTWVSKMSQPYVEKIANQVIRKAGTFGIDKISEVSGEKFTEK
jgi:hypothetical protein